MTASLTVEGATVRFGEVVALDHVSVGIAPGEVVAVLGPSGSGKSTLLRAIAGLQHIDAGAVLLDGRDLVGVPPHRRGIGLMFQDHALFPHRNVGGNVAFGLRMQGRGREAIARRVEELLELVDLVGFGRRRIQTLSGGEQQRVALARALAPEPQVLLLDEPLGALDRTLRTHLTTELRTLFVRLGLTVVAVTHDQDEAFALADRVALMDAGAILQAGPPAEVWAAPDSRRAAELLGFANLLTAQVARGRAHTEWGEILLPDAPDGLAAMLIRPTGVRLVANQGGVAARVLRCAFAGDRTTVTLSLEGGASLEALVRTSTAPEPGQRVGVVIDPDAVVVLRS